MVGSPSSAVTPPPARLVPRCHPPGVRVVAYPGDLTAQGLVLYTPDGRYKSPVTEPASARNGWNPTTYTFDPKRAAAVRISEQPTPQNGYKLVLLTESSKMPVIVLEWRAP